MRTPNAGPSQSDDARTPVKSGQAVEPLLSVEDVAALLKCSKNHVRNLVARGELAVVRVGKLIRFSIEELRAFISRQSQPQGRAAP